MGTENQTIEGLRKENELLQKENSYLKQQIRSKLSNNSYANRIPIDVFSKIFEKSFAAIAISKLIRDDEGRPVDFVFLSLNKSTEAHTGYKIEQLLGKTVYELLPPDEAKYFLELYSRVVETGEPIVYERFFPIFKKTLNVNAIKIDNDHFALIYDDATEKIKLELALKNHLAFMEKVNTVLNSSEPLDIFMPKLLETVLEIFQIDRVLILCPYNNDATEWYVPYMASTKGYERKNEQPRKIEASAFLSDYLKVMFSTNDVVVTNMETAGKLSPLFTQYSIKNQIQLKIPFKNNHPWIFIAQSCKIEKDWSNEELKLFAEIGRRVSDTFQRLKYLEQLEKSEDKFRTLVETTSDMIWEIDLNGIFTYISPKVFDLLGYRPDEILGKNAFDLMSKEEAERVTIEFSEYVSNKQPFTGLLNVNLHKDGREVIVESNGIPILDKNNNLIGYRGIDRDITDRKKFEEELKMAKERAEQSDRLKSAFLANMSHEIRTPMNGILGFSNLLKTDDATPEQQEKYIDLIQQSGERLLGLINDLIDISKIESGLMPMNITEFNILETTDYIFHFFYQEARAKGIELKNTVRIPNDKALIKSDFEKVIAIFTNLVKNAIKYSDNGTIEIGGVSEDIKYSFYIKDTGIGIELHRTDAIFDRFVQADISDTRSQQGAGLGLSITKAYIEMLNGEIWLESEYGKGSTFFFTLPKKVSS